MLSAGRDAERLGFDGVFAFDHLLPLFGPPEGPALECFTTLAAVAAVTSRVAVGSLVARAGLRPPGMLAKLAATLDGISGGRAILGLGTGDERSDREHRMFGLATPPAGDRRSRLEETAVAVTALLAGRAYPGGTLVPTLDGPVSPAPVRPGGPPVWIGGTSPSIARLAGRVADGWNGWGMDVERFTQMVKVLDDSGRAVEATWSGIVLMGEDQAETERLASERADRGVPLGDLTAPAEAVVERLGELSAAGASWAILLLAGPPDRRALFAEHVLPALR